MEHYRKGSHTVYDIKYHFVWITKYRKRILKGPVAQRVRELTVEVCRANEIEILQGLGIHPLAGNHHIHCPYPHHEDRHPSWRWMHDQRRAVCTCSPPHSVIDVVIKMGCAQDFAEACAWVRRALGIR